MWAKSAVGTMQELNSEYEIGDMNFESVIGRSAGKGESGGQRTRRQDGRKSCCLEIGGGGYHWILEDGSAGLPYLLYGKAYFKP